MSQPDKCGSAHGRRQEDGAVGRPTSQLAAAPSAATKPVYAYVRKAQYAEVTLDQAWSMWRAVFPKSTRAMFRAVWKDVKAALEVEANA